jgi:electron transfer flavoprotein beta subunit
MKIIVCIKSVLDVTFPFVLDQEKLIPLEEDVFYRVNPADKSAMEVALTLKETYGGEVIILSYGPSQVETALRSCLTMGGDKAVRIWEDRVDARSRAKAYLLSKAAEKFSPELVLCGSLSLDEGTGETPVAVAEFLGIPQVTGVTDLSYSNENHTITVKRKLERGWREEIECRFPVLLSVEPGIIQPRYGAMPDLLAAKRADIACLTGADLEVDFSFIQELNSLVRFDKCSMPRPRPKKAFNMESGLSAEERMELMMSGGVKQSKSDLLEGPPEKLAQQLMNILKEKIDIRPN